MSGPTEQQIEAMRIVLENNPHHTIAWCDDHGAYSTMENSVHPHSAAAKRIKAGFFLRSATAVVEEFKMPVRKSEQREPTLTERCRADAIAAQVEQAAKKPGLSANAPKVDPYAIQRAREQTRNVSQLTFDHPSNVRARKVAALRESLSSKFEPRFPPEGRSDRVYERNRNHG